MASRATVTQLLAIFDQAYDRRSWHGPNLRGALRGISARQAAWRPGPGRHNIGEITVHCAYWKYSAWRRLTGEKRGSFALRGSNWFRRPEKLTDAAWRADVALLGEMHRTLRAAINSMTAGDLKRRRGRSPFDNAALIAGIAAHDLYHAGQIQLIKRMRG